MIDIYPQTFRSFQPTFRFHMPFLTFKARIISAQQSEQSWCLETYKLFASAQKQLAHPLFSFYSVCNFLLQTLQYLKNRKNNCPWKHEKKTALKSSIFLVLPLSTKLAQISNSVPKKLLTAWLMIMTLSARITTMKIDYSLKVSH